MSDLLKGVALVAVGVFFFAPERNTQPAARATRLNPGQPRITETCDPSKANYAGYYDPNTNTVHLCTQNIVSPAHRRYVLAHELAHAEQWRTGHNWHDPHIELDADRRALNGLLAKGDCEAIRANATNATTHPKYRPGVEYARSIYRQNCDPQ